MTSNFDLILPYVRSLAPLIADEEVSEIMVNASGAVFIEREGLLSAIDGIVIPERQRQAAATASDLDVAASPAVSAFRSHL